MIVGIACGACKTNLLQHTPHSCTLSDSWMRAAQQKHNIWFPLTVCMHSFTHKPSLLSMQSLVLVVCVSELGQTCSAITIAIPRFQIVILTKFKGGFRGDQLLYYFLLVTCQKHFQVTACQHMICLIYWHLDLWWLSWNGMIKIQDKYEKRKPNNWGQAYKILLIIARPRHSKAIVFFFSFFLSLNLWDCTVSYVTMLSYSRHWFVYPA